ncbi:hypothetical protein Zmor_023390 [Zophobas morio]|uniref:Protein sleepless n=1 Tax=Zophobas morio TaxID=2755281 RepID=A0AA38M6C1_9CUCU|nr:hypothetical protein Zmor_023390 [Zophobas morio]
MSPKTPQVLLFLAAFLGVFQLGLSLKCYKCNGCETASTLKETCRDVDPQTEQSGCMTQVVRTGGTAGSLTVKKCAVYGKDDRFECPVLPSGDTVACSMCHEDFCNSGTKIATNFYLYLSIFVMLLVPRFFNL